MPDRLRNRPANLRHVEVVSCLFGGGLVLPALFAVHPLEEHSVVLVGRHRQRGVADAAVSVPILGVRSRGPLVGTDHDHLAVAVRLDLLNQGKRRRLYSPKLADLLSDHRPFRRRGKQGPTAAFVQEGAHRPGRLATHTNRLLQLQALGLPRARQRRDNVGSRFQDLTVLRLRPVVTRPVARP